MSEKHDLMCFRRDCSSGCCFSETWCECTNQRLRFLCEFKQIKPEDACLRFFSRRQSHNRLHTGSSSLEQGIAVSGTAYPRNPPGPTDRTLWRAAKTGVTIFSWQDKQINYLQVLQIVFLDVLGEVVDLDRAGHGAQSKHGGTISDCALTVEGTLRVH